METIKKLKLGLLLSCVAMLLAGCFGKKKSDSKKVDYAGSSSKKKKSVKRWDPNLEAYVFDGNDSDEMLAMAQSRNEFQKVYFDFDKTDIKDKSVADYDAKLAKVKAEAGQEIVVIGKSDTHCISEVYNTAVSQGRADALAKEFTVAGVDRSKIKAIGLGDTQLEVPVKGKEPLNRCVVVHAA